MKSSFLFLLLSGAAFGATPSLETPATFRDADPSALTWKSAEPAEHFARGEWWKLFADPSLDELETRALAANQDLRAAAARVEQARAAAGLARSNYWPQIAANGFVTRERTSSTTEAVFPDRVTTTYAAPLSVSWELDCLVASVT
jgi:outer membrane protein, multidrug efflux system